MSIFGTTSPKFVAGATTVHLYHSTLSPKFMVNDFREFKSVLTGSKKFLAKGSYSEFKVKVNLFKYADPTQTAIDLLGYNQTVIDEFYPFADGESVQDGSGQPVKFFVTIELAFLTQANKHDLAILTFKSVEYTRAKQSLITDIS